MKVASFNVKNLGMSKVRNNTVREYLIRIVSRYSVIVMLEVKDNTAMEMFLDELNKYKENIGRPFGIKYSEPLGRGTHRESFVFFYRKKEMKLIDWYQYEEDDKDVLTREPFVVRFKCPDTAVQDLVLIPVHTRPQNAEMELYALQDVVKAVKRKWGINNIMILGDFNADGRYFLEQDKNRLPIFRPPYHWLIDDDVDTTTSNNNDNTYDRIVVCGDGIYKGVVENSAKAFNFQQEYQLTNAVAKSISDHYPVEVELREKGKDEKEDDKGEEEEDDEDEEEDDEDEEEEDDEDEEEDDEDEEEDDDEDEEEEDDEDEEEEDDEDEEEDDDEDYEEEED